MRKVALALVVIFACTAVASAQTERDKLRLGVGFAVPVSGQQIVTEAHNDSGGITHADKVLDASPQLVVEVHRSWAINSGRSVRIGPMAAFLPKVDFGLAGNAETQQGVGAGFGAIMEFNAGGNRSFNLGFMYVIQQPVSSLTPEFRPGFQAPRGIGGEIVNPIFREESPRRLFFSFTVSGLFG